MEIGDFVRKKVQEDGEEVEVLQVTDKVDIDGVTYINLKGKLANYNEKYFEVVGEEKRDNFAEYTEPTIKDSGERRVFETGSVRDIQVGKGRCDLMPLDVVAGFFTCDNKTCKTLQNIYEFTSTGKPIWLSRALDEFNEGAYKNSRTMFLEVSIHFEQGALKYGENNWQKGIPTHCYINSAVRHYLKYLRIWNR